MMAKRRAARHDPLETVIPTAHWLIGGIDYKIGGACLAAAAVTAMEICAVSGVSCGSKTAIAERTQRAARPPAWLPRIEATSVGAKSSATGCAVPNSARLWKITRNSAGNSRWPYWSRRGGGTLLPSFIKISNMVFE
jgi:hypothetical protein